ncbi:MAG: 50S ribosomal protein L15 [Planctomycetaceae bacterium]|nr:50S ribosomal protein L15 [Planctomycetaceae bacterium]
MNLNEVHREIHKNKSRKRIGRGPGSGQGETAGRGSKGQGSRSGSSVSPIFEGGQMPLVRRVPKRGFNNRWAETVVAVNLDVLDRNFQSGEEVTPEAICGKKIIHGRYDQVKVLGNGELTKGLKISAHKFSRSALEKIEKAGGQAVVLPGKAPVVKNKMKVKNR